MKKIFSVILLLVVAGNALAVGSNWTDGGGDSFHSQNVSIYGRDYSNWNAATPTAGF